MRKPNAFLLLIFGFQLSHNSQHEPKAYCSRISVLTCFFLLCYTDAVFKEINHLAMPIFAAISETLNIYGPIAAHQLGHDFGLVESASELTQDIKHPAQTPFGVLESSEMLLQSAETTFDLVSWKHRELAENIEKLRSQLEQTKASPKKEAKDANLQRIYPASRDRRWQHYWESIEAEEFEEYYGALSNIMRRRCVDGYLFDCIKNQKLTSNDPWLQDMWAWIEGEWHGCTQTPTLLTSLRRTTSS